MGMKRAGRARRATGEQPRPPDAEIEPQGQRTGLSGVEASPSVCREAFAARYYLFWSIAQNLTTMRVMLPIIRQVLGRLGMGRYTSGEAPAWVAVAGVNE